MPPITLTPAAFKATAVGQRPGSSYANYRSFLARRRAAPVAQTPVNPIASILASYQAGIQTPAQQAASAHRSVLDQIAAQTSANNAAIVLQNKQLADQAQRAQGFALALGQATAPDPNQIKGFYQEAADRLKGYGTGLTGAVASDQQAQADAARAAVERVTGGLGQVTSYDPAALRNAAQMASVTIPGSSLESQAAAAAAQSAYGRQASAANIGSIAQGYLQKQSDLQAQVDAQNAALRAQEPTLYRQQLASQATTNRQDMATLLSALGLMNTQASTQSLITHRKKQDLPAMDASNSKANGYKTDQYGNAILGPKGGLQPLPGYTINAGGTRAIPKPGTKGGPKAPGATHMQSKTINGNVVLFDPGPPGRYYLPGDTKNPVDPNNLRPKNVNTDKIRQGRAQATAAVTGTLKTSPKTLPRVMYTNGVAKGIPGWALYQALKAEAVNHPNDPAWVDVLQPGWVAGRGR